jgi:hypothetical protein
MSKSLPGRRGLIEALLVVASILLAFAIDAWWDGLEAIRVESGLLQDLSAEVERNRIDLDATLGRAERWGSDVERFLGSAPDQMFRVPPDSIRWYAIALTRGATFDPREAAASLLLQTPLTRSPASLRVRALVSEWRTALDDAEEDRERLLSAADDVARQVSRHVTASAGGENLPTVAGLAGPPLLARLRGDEAFVAAVAFKADAPLLYVRELAAARVALDSLAVALRFHGVE